MADPICARTPTVFVVDDDPSICRALGRLLRVAGYRAVVFDSAEELLASWDLSASAPACLVVDVKLPGLSGLDLHATLRERGFSLPTIFITAHGDMAIGTRAIRGGVVAVLIKPFDDGVLLVAVEHAIQQSHDDAERSY